MATIKSCTDIPQSKALAKILRLESADMYYSAGNETQPTFRLHSYGHIMSDKDVPAWSLSALLDRLKIFTTPTAFSVKVCVPLLSKTNNGYSLTYTGDYTLMDNNNLDIESPIEVVKDNPVDACVEMIIKLNELNLL